MFIPKYIQTKRNSVCEPRPGLFALAQWPGASHATFTEAWRLSRNFYRGLAFVTQLLPRPGVAGHGNAATARPRRRGPAAPKHQRVGMERAFHPAPRISVQCPRTWKTPSDRTARQKWTCYAGKRDTRRLHSDPPRGARCGPGQSAGMAPQKARCTSVRRRGRRSADKKDTHPRRWSHPGAGPGPTPGTVWRGAVMSYCGMA